MKHTKKPENRDKTQNKLMETLLVGSQALDLLEQEFI
jgi:hypothetical protein